MCCMQAKLIKVSIHYLIFSYSLEQVLASVYDIRQFGAVGDGKTNDTQAFVAAWDNLCRDAEAMPMLIIPQGYNFYLSPLQIQGPCISSSIHIQVMGTIVAPKGIEEWRRCPSNSWIAFKEVNGLILEGCSGVFDGQGSPWWSNAAHDNINNSTSGGCDRPTALHFSECNGLVINGLTHLNSPRNHIGITRCNGVEISYLYVVAPPDSPNTDGIDISSSSNVFIRDSTIQTGDDCIAINSGSSKINITNVDCGPGHGISIGSLGANGQFSSVEEVYVKNCNFSGTSNGARIKTWPGGSGYARNIHFENIQFNDVKNPIIIDQHYCDPSNNCPEKPTAVQVSDVTYKHMKGSSASKEAIILDCSENVPCLNIVLDQIDIMLNVPGRKGELASATCKNAQATSFYTNPSMPTCTGSTRSSSNNTTTLC